jgi:carboxypeptidase Taq
LDGLPLKQIKHHLDSMTAYENLCQLAHEIALLGSTASTLGWDQETYMPAKALDHRAEQLAYLSAKSHALATGKAFRKTLDLALKEGAARGSQKAANLREWAYEIERASRIPTLLVAEESNITAHARNVWVEARKKSDFSIFSAYLEKILSIARRKAELWGYQDEPYDALLVGYERGARTRSIAHLFDELQPRVTAIAKSAVDKSRAIPSTLLRGKYPSAKQQQLNREVAASIGYDFEAGRIDTTTHPFCTTLGPMDVRLTTRYDEADFTSSLFGVLHEAGHGLYEQGLPAHEFGRPAGTSVSLGIHESQSRLWENHVGRSQAFWEKWLPRASELFPSLRKLSIGDFMAAIHRAQFSFIRVEADEATYDLHILLRFHIERRLLAGSLEVRQIPHAWNDQFEHLFGVRPPDDARGCLQDIHWSMGGLGYFATYTLGNLNAAQLYAHANRDRKIRSASASANYAPLLAWLRTHIHSHGSALLPNKLIARATGRTTDSTAYLSHLRERFGPGRTKRDL